MAGPAVASAAKGWKKQKEGENSPGSFEEAAEDDEVTGNLHRDITKKSQVKSPPLESHEVPQKSR